MANVYTPPPRTMIEAFRCLPEGTLAQLINNQIIMSPAPGNAHQKVSGKIFSQLLLFVEETQLGEVRIAPFDVFLNSKNAYQPDIIFIATENLNKIKEDGFHGSPDLVIEIFSPATRQYDKGDKKDIYQRCGVKEYWMVDPVTKTAEGLYLINNKFHQIVISKEIISFKLFPLSINF